MKNNLSNVDFTKQPQTAISICTGIRGLERGLERAGVEFRTVCYVEREAFIIENLVCQMEAGLLDPAPIWPDLRSFDGRKFYGLVDWIIGGYPCQGESLAGKRELENYEGYLWPAVRDAVAAIRPRGCFFENVDDHLTGTFPYVLADLRDLGYTVEAGVFSAEEAGAPHERNRLFILALLANGNGEWEQQPPRIITKGRERAGNCSKEGGKLAYPDDGSVINESGGHEKGSGGKGLRQQNVGEELGESVDVDNTSGHGFGPEYEIQAGRNGAESSNKELSNANVTRLSEPTWRRIRSVRETPGEPKGSESGGVPAEGARGLADADFCRQQPGFFARVGRKQESFQGWPSRPGQPQHGWEQPRTLTRQTESKMGLSAHGHNFREDILRALGNSVVEQQAEIAWKELWKKITLTKRL